MTDRAAWRPPRWLDVLTGWSWRLLVVGAVVVAAVVGLSRVRPVVLPLLLGLVVTSVLWPLVGMMRARGVPRAAAAGVGLLLVIAMIALLVGLLVEALIGPWDALVDEVEVGYDATVDELERRLGIDAGEFADRFRSGTGGLTDMLLGGVTGAVGVVVELVTTLVVTLLVVFFYLKDGPEMWTWFLGHQRRHRDEVDRVGRAMWAKVRDFVRGVAIVAAVDAVGIALGAWILGVPSVLAIFVLTFMLSFIPFFGAVFAGGVTVALAVADGGVVRGLWMLGVVVAVQQLESNVLEPVLVGRSVRLHPLVVALGVIAGGTLAGVVGMFLAVPLIAAITAGVSELRQVVPDD